MQGGPDSSVFSRVMVALTLIFALPFTSGALFDGLSQRVMIRTTLVWVMAVGLQL